MRQLLSPRVDSGGLAQDNFVNTVGEFARLMLTDLGALRW